MNTAKNEMKALINSLPDDCTFEDMQYHLYVTEKINNGIASAEKEGALSQQEIEGKFSKWINP